MSTRSRISFKLWMTPLSAQSDIGLVVVPYRMRSAEQLGDSRCKKLFAHRRSISPVLLAMF
jgi:hypothetical protein